MFLQGKCTLLVLMILASLAPANLPADSYDFDSLVNSMEKAYSNVRDYTCVMNKKEKIGEKLIEMNNINYKHKKPNFYYLKFNEGFYSGMEVLYAGKKYDGKLLVHLGGILNVKNVSLDPKSAAAMKNNRHSVLESDIGFIIRLIRSNYDKAKKAGEGAFTFDGEKKLFGRPALVFKAVFPARKGYHGKLIELYVDKDLMLPLQLSVWGWNDELLEKYQFTKLKINPGLKDIDFDEKNPAYSY
ncbi:MAG: DUF1571 domain-containing protein [Chloroflexota bacterium]